MWRSHNRRLMGARRASWAATCACVERASAPRHDPRLGRAAAAEAGRRRRGAAAGRRGRGGGGGRAGGPAGGGGAGGGGGGAGEQGGGRLSLGGSKKATGHPYDAGLLF